MAVEIVSNTNTSELESVVMKEEQLDVTETESSENYDQDPNSPLPSNNSNNDLDQPRMVNGEDWNHITKPGEHDVLLGRGGGTNNHCGNIKFRKLVNEHKMRYLACSKVDKPKVARQVVGIWRKLEPAGRFLARKDDTKRGPGSVKSSDNVWYEVGDKKAREKASQCLRERTPDVIPYIKHLREQQNAITEQGVSMVQLQMQQHEQQQQHHHMAMNPAALSPHHQPHPAVSMMHHSPVPYAPYMDPSGSSGSPYHSPTPHTFAPRRNSMPNQPLPVFHSPVDNRRGSLPSASNNNNNNTTNHPQDLSEMEYQHQMMMMHQNMMQQQMQMQQLHHNRMQSRMRSFSPDAAPSNHEASPHKRGRDEEASDDEAASQHDQEAAERPTAPDRAISLMSLTPADPDNHELSLEDYREQLERYIANSGGLPDGDESDLEDDWERERERALLQHNTSKSRGVGRNISGMSCFSQKSNMSLVSGFSVFSDLSKKSDQNNNNNNANANNNARETKMNMARSVCSNLSLMSELTDLSHNIDNLSIYDE